MAQSRQRETGHVRDRDARRRTDHACRPSQVEEVIVQSEALRRYEELLPKVPNTVEGHLDMAERCRKAGLKEQREFHLEKVLELDPNQADARRGLGYSQVDGQWIRADEWFENQGYVRHKGGWRLPQEVDLDTRHDRQVVEEKEWRKRLQVWRNSVVRGRNDAAEALAQLRAVDSPLAIAGLSEMLADSEEPKQLKLLYIDVLGKFRSRSAVAALLKRVMQDPDLEIRERSIDAAKVHGSQQAVAVLTPHAQGQGQPGGESGGLGARPTRRSGGRSRLDRRLGDQTSFQGADRQRPGRHHRRLQPAGRRRDAGWRGVKIIERSSRTGRCSVPSRHSYPPASTSRTTRRPGRTGMPRSSRTRPGTNLRRDL